MPIGCGTTHREISRFVATHFIFVVSAAYNEVYGGRCLGTATKWSPEPKETDLSLTAASAVKQIIQKFQLSKVNPLRVV